MNTNKTMPVLLLISFLLSVFAASCGRDSNVDVAVIVALTQTAAALQNPAPTAAAETQIPVVAPTQQPGAASTQLLVVAPTQQPVVASGYQPLNTDECNALSNALSTNMGYPGVVILPVPFEDFFNKQSGLGCQITFSETGDHITGLDMLMTPATSTMQGLGWVDDSLHYGSGGPGALGTAFSKGDTLCLALFKTEAVDPALCPGNEPISMCWSRLAPEQMKYSATFNCSTYMP